MAITKISSIGAQVSSAFYAGVSPIMQLRVCVMKIEHIKK